MQTNGHDTHATFVAQHLLRNKSRATFIAGFHVTHAIFVGRRSAWKWQTSIRIQSMKLLLPSFFALIRKDFVGLDQNSTTQHDDYGFDARKWRNELSNIYMKVVIRKTYPLCLEYIVHDASESVDIS